MVIQVWMSLNIFTTERTGIQSDYSQPSWVHRQSVIAICALQWSYKRAYKNIAHLSVFHPIGQLFPWIHTGGGQADRHRPSKRMYEQNSNIIFCNILSTFTIKTWLNIHIVHSLWQLKCCYTLYFLASCTSFGIQCKSTRVHQKENQVNKLLKINI